MAHYSRVKKQVNAYIRGIKNGIAFLRNNRLVEVQVPIPGLATKSRTTFDVHFVTQNINTGEIYISPRQ